MFGSRYHEYNALITSKRFKSQGESRYSLRSCKHCHVFERTRGVQIPEDPASFLVSRSTYYSFTLPNSGKSLFAASDESPGEVLNSNFVPGDFSHTVFKSASNMTVYSLFARIPKPLAPHIRSILPVSRKSAKFSKLTRKPHQISSQQEFPPTSPYFRWASTLGIDTMHRRL